MILFIWKFYIMEFYPQAQTRNNCLIPSPNASDLLSALRLHWYKLLSLLLRLLNRPLIFFFCVCLGWCLCVYECMNAPVSVCMCMQRPQVDTRHHTQSLCLLLFLCFWNRVFIEHRVCSWSFLIQLNWLSNCLSFPSVSQALKVGTQHFFLWC